MKQYTQPMITVQKQAGEDILTMSYTAKGNGTNYSFDSVMRPDA